jgi:acetylornithine/N-succinyldiaminopimelate aminotransferase
LIAIEFSDENLVEEIRNKCLMNGLIINITQKKVIRIFPALNTTKNEIDEGLNILKIVLDKCVKNK